MSDTIMYLRYVCKECNEQIVCRIIIPDAVGNLFDYLGMPVDELPISEGKKDLLRQKLCPECFPLHVIAPSLN